MKKMVYIVQWITPSHSVTPCMYFTDFKSLSKINLNNKVGYYYEISVLIQGRGNIDTTDIQNTENK